MSGVYINQNEKDPQKQNIVIRQLIEGRSNAVGSVTLNASSTTTTVTAPNCGADSHVFLMPRTANAASVVAATYVSSVIAGQFILTHPSNANSNKTFSWVALG